METEWQPEHLWSRIIHLIIDIGNGWLQMQSFFMLLSWLKTLHFGEIYSLPSCRIYSLRHFIALGQLRRPLILCFSVPYLKYTFQFCLEDHDFIFCVCWWNGSNEKSSKQTEVVWKLVIVVFMNHKHFLLKLPGIPVSFLVQYLTVEASDGCRGIVFNILPQGWLVTCQPYHSPPF